MSKMKTNEAALNSLFDAMVDAFKQKLEDGSATASDLNVIRQFLKDNGIEFIPGGETSQEERQRLADILPFRADKAARA